MKLRHGRDNAGEAFVQARLIDANVLVRHAARDLVDLRKRAIDGLENLERLLLHHIERTYDALVGDAVNIAVADPAAVSEQRRRQDHRGDHHGLQQASGRFPCAAHRLPSPRRLSQTPAI